MNRFVLFFLFYCSVFLLFLAFLPGNTRTKQIKFQKGVMVINDVTIVIVTLDLERYVTIYDNFELCLMEFNRILEYFIAGGKLVRKS